MDMNAGREESESEDKSHPAVFETTAVKPQAGISDFWANIRILESESHSILNVEELVSQRKYIQRSHFRLISRKGFFQSAMFLASALKRGSHPSENILKI
jgi:hypothetical protein